MTLLSRILRNAGSVARRVRASVLGPRVPTAGAAPPTAATIDLDDPAVARDPFPCYEALRAAGPVQYLARHDAWIVLDHEEVKSAFMRPHLFSNRPYEDVDAVLLAADPPEHTAVRRIVSAYFSREVIERLGAFAAERAAALLKPRLDVVREYAQPLSEAVAARLLGVDDATVEAIRAAAARSPAFAQYVRELDRLADRAEMYGRLRGDGLDDGQARSLVRLLWVASTKTSERAIAQCVLRLLRHEDVRLALRDDPAKIGPFIEEVLRLHQPEPMLRRVTREAVDLGGVTIPAGAMVNLCLAAANRDPAVYEHPAELRLDRPAARHLTFGYGIHHCVGARLGRAEVTAAVRTLLLDAPRFRAAQPLDSVPYCATMTAHYIESLVVDITPGGGTV
ncbi:MAG TPA: cytochrome P450 [Longimicrobiaceae bacterium]|nr:cytochrome P450 [Longimicrobiaceae bacterium]